MGRLLTQHLGLRHHRPIVCANVLCAFAFLLELVLVVVDHGYGHVLHDYARDYRAYGYELVSLLVVAVLASEVGQQFRLPKFHLPGCSLLVTT